VNILIANVSGINSNEIRVLAEILSQNHKITISCMAIPSHQKGNAFSYGGFPVKFKKTDYIVNGEDVDCYEFFGTPADMISIMLGNIMEHRKPDIVVCGINNGLTIGTDSFCSSNIGMAMESMFARVPVVAVAVPIKLGGHSRDELLPPAQFIAKNIVKILEMRLPADTFLNVSCPVVSQYSDYQGVAIGSMDNLTKLTNYEEKVDSNGNTYYWTKYAQRDSADDLGKSPTSALSYFSKNYITVAPLTYDNTDYFAISRLREGK
jgi:5'-nucleotidase